MTTRPNFVDLQLRLKLRQLRVFLAIIEHGTLIKAAEHLHLSQPAVTKYLNDLEGIVGAKLFNRTARGVTPTSFGEALNEHAGLIMSELRQVSEKLAGLATGHIGAVIVGTLLAAAPRLLPRSVIRFKRQRPTLTVTITEGTNDRLLPALRQGALDLVVGRVPEPRDLHELTHEILYDDPIHLVARTGHPLAKASALLLADLIDQHWILPPPQTTLRRQIDDAFRLAGLAPPAHLVETVSILTIRTLLLETNMIGVLPYAVLKSDAEQGLIATLPLAIPTALRPIAIMRRAEKALSPAAELFCECLRQVSRELAPQGATGSR